MVSELRVPVHVQARSSRRRIGGVAGGRLKIYTTAPPREGRANDDVQRQLASAFGVPPSRVRLKSGANRRSKVFTVTDPAVQPAWLDELDFCRNVFFGL